MWRGKVIVSNRCAMMVPPEGPKDAKIMFIGEAPGETEEKHGRPFVGVAGRVLDGLLEEVGIRRSDCYITNVYKHRPRGNDISTVDAGELARARSELMEEVVSVNPNVICALGETAFVTLFPDKRNITKWRGSVLEHHLGKVVPCIHPASISREWAFRPVTAVDFAKVKAEAGSKEVSKAHRELVINPTYEQCLEYLTDVQLSKHKVAFDIETETHQISCISFAVSGWMSLCIPFWFGASGSYWTEEQELAIWQKIKEVLEDASIPKIAQNAQYDMTILRDIYGIVTQGLWLDTMIAFHALYPELPKGLDLLTSIYTDVNYYKYQRLTEDMNEFFRYNALDSAVTYECAEKIHQEMLEFNVWDFYNEHMHSLIGPLMHICQRGILIDTARKNKAIAELGRSMESMQLRLNALAGHAVNVNSPKQMKAWLYDELKLPTKYKLRKDKGEKTVAADEEALLDLYKETNNEALKIVLDIRECRKLLSTYLEKDYDKEEGMERARTSYLITGTETGRLSSRETVYGTGTNLQNIPKGVVRSIFIPDDGKVFVNADLSQAEARVVAYLAGEDRLIRVFTDGGDIHRKNASNIFRVPEESVTAEQRELAKRLVHASNYGMGPVTFARHAGCTVAHAKQLLNAYFTQYPKIKLWHLQTASKLRASRTLTTPFGRKRTFFSQWSDAVLKEAYAFIPQSTIADLLNMGLRAYYAQTRGTETEILLQIHDAILCQTPRDKVEETVAGIRKALTIPIRINGRECIIPVEVSVGETWDDLKKV